MKKKKYLQYMIVGIILLIAFVVYLNVHPERWLKTTGDPVSATELAANQQTDYTGYAAGEGFSPMQGIEDFQAILPNKQNYAVAAPIGIIPTGIFIKMPWWKPTFAAGTRQAYRNGNVPSVTTSAVFGSDYNYSEYFLIQLPDHSYILALMDRGFATALQKGEQITLPLGHKEGKLDEATRLLQPILDEYGVSEKYVLYTMNNALYEKNSLTATVIRAGIAAGTFILLAFVVSLALGKVFSEKAEDEDCKKV